MCGRHCRKCQVSRNPGDREISKETESCALPGDPAAAYPRLKAEFAVLRPEGNVWKIPDGGSIGVWFPPQIDPEEGSGDE